MLNHYALESLRSFPAGEAIELTTRLFALTSPRHVRILRGVGRVVGAPFRAARTLAHKVERWASREREQPHKLQDDIARDLLLAANSLRNDLLDDTVIVQTRHTDHLAVATRRVAQTAPCSDRLRVERIDRRLANVHVPKPEAIRAHQPELLEQDWDSVMASLRAAAEQLTGLPGDIEAELWQEVLAFRQQMSWGQKLRETFFASLSTIPPLLGVTYTLLTADPLSGSGLAFQLESVLGLNDLWALVSIPASAGLSQQDSRQLEHMLAPVFGLWLTRRLEAIVDLLTSTVCRPIAEILEQLPQPNDGRFRQVERALATIEEEP